MRVNIRYKVYPIDRNALPCAIRRGTSTNANKYHIRCTRMRGPWEKPRKRASRRATPDRAGARRYHGVGIDLQGFLILTRMGSKK